MGCLAARLGPATAGGGVELSGASCDAVVTAPPRALALVRSQSGGEVKECDPPTDIKEEPGRSPVLFAGI
jgi:hypothetical protein